VSRFDTRLYPRSFSAFQLLADLLFRAGDRDAALAAARKSLALEPHCSATRNLVQKIETVARPLTFTPVGRYELAYTNRVSGELAKARLDVAAGARGVLSGTMTDADGRTSALRSVVAGGDRLWAVADTPFGPIEFRVLVSGARLTGDWAAPFGRNGLLEGRRTDGPARGPTGP
jgi:hypothetical protein